MKITKFKPFVRDTIFVGNFSRDAKIHTIENIVRVVGVFILVSGLHISIKCLAVVLVGIHLESKNKKEIEFKFW